MTFFKIFYTTKRDNSVNYYFWFIYQYIIKIQRYKLDISTKKPPTLCRVAAANIMWLMVMVV